MQIYYRERFRGDKASIDSKEEAIIKEPARDILHPKDGLRRAKVKFSKGSPNIETGYSNHELIVDREILEGEEANQVKDTSSVSEEIHVCNHEEGQPCVLRPIEKPDVVKFGSLGIGMDS